MRGREYPTVLTVSWGVTISNETPQPTAPALADASAPARDVPPPFDVVRRGFDRGQVLLHLRALADRIRDLESRVATTDGSSTAEPSTGEGAGDPLDGVSEHLRALLGAFDEEVARQRRKAKREATVVTAEARTAAAQMRLEAQDVHEEAVSEARRILLVAREEAAAVRAEATSLRESAIADLRSIRERMRRSLDELESSIDQGGAERVIVLDEPPAKDQPTLPQASSSGK